MLNEEVEDTSGMEALLGRYRPVAPPPDGAGRARVLRRAEEQSRGAYWEAMAAVLLVGMTLAQIGGTVTQVIDLPPAGDGRTQEIAAALGRMELPLNAEERQIMAAQLAAGDRLVRLPQLHGGVMNDTNTGVMQ